MTIDFHTLEALQRKHPSWRLLRADHASLIIAVLYRQFVDPNQRTIARDELIAKVEDELFRLREQLGDDAFPRSAAQYLDDWAADEKGWLRKYYPPGSDDPHYDITPATEKAIEWIRSLEDRHFVGTESRVLTVFELLRQLTQETQLDPNVRIAELEKRRAAIDAEILRVREGELLLLDPTQVKERFLQMAAMARGILSDFRELDQNFRDLDRSVRERIASASESRGTLLDEIFGDRDEIERSDQGKSFRAFWDFLMSPDRQEELSALLRSVMDLEDVRSLLPDPRLARIHYDWLEAGEVAQRTVARLSQQLRRYLDDQARLENRRITQLIAQIEQHALAMRSQFPTGPSMEIDAERPSIDLPFERPLFSPPVATSLDDHPLEAGDEHISADALFDQVFVDKHRLAQNVRRALQERHQVSLTDLIAAHPLEHGLAELVAYLSVASDDQFALIDDAYADNVSWHDADGTARRATFPRVIFLRPTVAT
ncbi:MAG TPA: DUF3375 domain-containing protein [Gemmatimonadaceae bacterium]|jgi:hypothetical protein